MDSTGVTAFEGNQYLSGYIPSYIPFDIPMDSRYYFY